MSRRIEVELTSKKEDGTYTWRAAGAKKPKGELDGSLLYEGASVGDVVRAEAEFAVDGVFIVGVTPPKTKRAMPEMLEILGGRENEGSVTTQLVGKKGRGGNGRDRNGKRGRDERGGGRGRSERNRGQNRGRGDRDGRGRDRSPRNDARSKPKPKRLRAKRTHRDAAIKAVPEMQQPLARIVLRDGVPGLRQIIEKQNEAARKDSGVEIPPKVLEAVGENLLPALRAAEWRDNAEAALAGVDEIDLRDIRKVVVAAEKGARDEESKALAEDLKNRLSARVDAEHGKWLAELDSLLKEGRTVRALRQSSRPPKAGAPLPAELTERLVAGANAGMTAETSPDRWGTVLDAVAYSPIRTHVTPQGLPAKVTDELQATVKKLSKRIPHIASLFESQPAS